MLNTPSRSDQIMVSDLDNITRQSARSTYFAEFAGTILMLSITTRLVGLLFSPELLLVTGVSPILPSTSSPLINLPNVVY